MKLIHPRDICITILITAPFTITKKGKQHKCPATDEWIKKIRYIYTMEYYLAIKKNEILSCAATWMALKIVAYSEMSQAQKDKYCVFSLICGI